MMVFITDAPTGLIPPANACETSKLAAPRYPVSSHTSSAFATPLPTDRLSCKRGAHQQGRAYQPVVLLSCGSFNPPTVAHLRMFELGAHALGKVRSLWTSWVPNSCSLNSTCITQS